MSVTFTSKNKKASGSAPQAYIPSIIVPPNQIEFEGWCWTYYEVEAPTTVHLTATAYPEGTSVSFGWSHAEVNAPGLDLAFSPGNPLCAFWVLATIGSTGPHIAPVTYSFEEQ